MKSHTLHIEVSVESLAEVTSLCWKLLRWLETNTDATMPRYVARKLTTFVERVGFTTIDLTGKAFDPGFSVEVVDSLVDSSCSVEQGLVTEMVAPIVLWNGAVIKHGEVVLSKPSEAINSVG